MAKRYFKLESENKVAFYCLTENDDGRPMVKYSLVITQDLRFSMWSNETKVPTNKVAHVCKGNVLSSWSSVLNILTFLRNISEQKSTPPDINIEHCVSILSKVIPEIEDEKLMKKVSFLKEQLELSMKHKNGRRYSSDILACAVLWHNVSPALYRQILKEDILTLPSVDHIQDLSSGFSVESGMSEATKAYLKK